MKQSINGNVDYFTTKIPITFAQTIYTAYIFEPRLISLNEAILNSLMPMNGKRK